MFVACLALLFCQQISKSETVLWSYKPGQEFFVEETQRHLLQVRKPQVVSTYLDFTYLWRYFVLSEKNHQVRIQATLEKIRINNPNEAGARAVEELKQQAGSRSTWLLSRTGDGWKAEQLPGEQTRHAVPYFLTAGIADLKEAQEGWKQRWKIPVTDWGQADLEVTVQIKQRINDRLLTSIRAKMEWPADNKTTVSIHFQPSGSSIAGLGEFDFSKGRWNYFEFRLDGYWTVTRPEATTEMKQATYCGYKLSERRPTFP